VTSSKAATEQPLATPDMDSTENRLQEFSNLFDVLVQQKLDELQERINTSCKKNWIS